MKMCSWCGCAEFKQLQIREVYFNIENSDIKDISSDWIENKSAIVCPGCGRQYEFDGRELQEVEG